MKQADIREATVRAHDLEFAVIMELDVTEAAFKTFCADLKRQSGIGTSRKSWNSAGAQRALSRSITKMAHAIWWDKMPEADALSSKA
jgi:hypothetical protein